MKTLNIFLIVMLLGGFGAKAFAQTHDHSKMTGTQTTMKTETFKVLGSCDMCKDRIEKTVKAEGATTASWDSEKQMLTVTFDASKTSVDALSKKLAAVGHDTEKYKAQDEVYSKLPGCCHYDRSK
jgi:periplasmic mercuric ion binding protein